jgi:hypothetical protein
MHLPHSSRFDLGGEQHADSKAKICRPTIYIYTRHTIVFNPSYLELLVEILCCESVFSQPHLIWLEYNS